MNMPIFCAWARGLRAKGGLRKPILLTRCRWRTFGRLFGKSVNAFSDARVVERFTRAAWADPCARADAGRDRFVFHAAYGALRRAGYFLHGIFSRSREFESRETNP